jgi:cytochrome P450
MSSADSAQEVCMDEVIGCYTMDCISKTVFSIDIDAHKNPDSDFMQNGKAIISPWRFAVSALFPQIAALTGVSVFNFNALSFFGKLAREMIRQRDAMTNPPNDVLGLMMKVRDSKTSDLADASDAAGSKRAAGNLMTNHVIERTLMQFFMDGFDSVAAVASATVYFVAANPEIQERAFEEVDEMSSKRGANLTGDDINELKYLDCVVSEATRLATTAITLRICTKEWTIPDTQIKIPVDMRVVLPIAGMHYDPELFENPEVFDPDRFSSENKSKIRFGTFMPFGLGGRQCVGMGIAKLEVKVLLFHLLRNFKLQLAPRTTVPPVWAKDHFIKIEGGVWVKLQKRS